MHHEDIKATIRKKGVTLQQVAAHLGVKGTTLSQVIRGTVKSARLAKSIAELCDLSVGQLWPGLYDETRSPTPPAVLARLGTSARTPAPKAKTEKAASAPVAAAGEPTRAPTERRHDERRQGDRRHSSRRER